MIGYIFKNYANFLDKVFAKFTKSFQKKRKESLSNNTSIDKLNQEIALHQKNLIQKEEFQQKNEIRKRILFLELIKTTLLTQNEYLKVANRYLIDDSDDSIYETLYYIERIPFTTLNKEEQIELLLFKAKLYELLENFQKASKSYKKAIAIQTSIKALQEYKAFMQRYQELQQWEKETFGSESGKIFDKDYSKLSQNELLALAKLFEKNASYYVRSPQSRYLAKRYFKEVLKIYEKLFHKNANKFACEYVRVLLEAVEVFMLSPIFLKQAQTILAKKDLCEENRIYLLEKLQELKQKKFIQKNKWFQSTL